MSGIQIIMPAGMLGESEYDSALDKILRAIAASHSTDKSEWADKYGTRVDNDAFMMHPFCWCEQDECPWCLGCECPDTSIRHWIDARQVTEKQYDAFFAGMVRGHRVGSPEWDKAADEANCRRHTDRDPSVPLCDYCAGTGIFARFNTGQWHAPERHYFDPPNFWHKLTDFRVTWYKYIGRDVETNKPVTEEILRALAALIKDPVLEADTLA